jgi:hypothetical protein
VEYLRVNFRDRTVQGSRDSRRCRKAQTVRPRAEIACGTSFPQRIGTLENGNVGLTLGGTCNDQRSGMREVVCMLGADVRH